MEYAKKGNIYDNWAISDHPGYSYKIFNKEHKLHGIFPRKIFKNKHECENGYFYTLTRQGVPRGMLVPALLGNKNGKTILCDWINKNTLIAGQTRSGKTCFLQNLVLSLMYFNHGDYMKIVILDTKAAAFRDLKNIVNVVNEHEDVVAFLDILEKELRKRIEFTKKTGMPSDAKSANFQAFALQKPALAMPYIMVIFDEFAEFMQFCKQKNDFASIETIQNLASLGLGLGINLTFSTQAPYKEYIAGAVKNNFGRRISFSLGDFYQEQLILGKNKELDADTPTLKCGEFFKRERGFRQKYISPFAGQHALKNAARNLKHWGFEFFFTK